jgi:hypothetical protein
MSRILRYAVLAYMCVRIPLSLTARDVPLAAGNILQCTLDEPNLSSRTVKVVFHRRAKNDMKGGRIPCVTIR